MKLIAIIAASTLAACAPQTPERPDNGADAGTSANTSTRIDPAVVPDATRKPVAVPGTTSTLTSEGWGPLRIGMTRAEIETALGADADPDAVGGPDPETCDQFRPARAPTGMLVMVENGSLTRISLIRGSDVPTDRGIRLGDPAPRVRAAYGGSIRSAPHAYTDPQGGYLTSWARGDDAGEVRDPEARGIRYEIGADDRVLAIHAGGPSIQNVEGCV